MIDQLNVFVQVWKTRGWRLRIMSASRYCSYARVGPWLLSWKTASTLFPALVFCMLLPQVAHGCPLNLDGPVVSWNKLALPIPDYIPQPNDSYARSMARISERSETIAGRYLIGAPFACDQTGSPTGVVFVVDVSDTARVSLVSRITNGEGGFTGPLKTLDHFGQSIEVLGDLNDDGTTEVLIGSPGRLHSTGQPFGAVWLLSISHVGSVVSESLIDWNAFPVAFGFGTREFGYEMSAVKSVHGQSVLVFVGAPTSSHVALSAGQVFILHIDVNLTVRIDGMLTDLTDFGNDPLEGFDDFGRGLDAKLKGEPGKILLAVGSPGDWAPPASNEQGINYGPGAVRLYEVDEMGFSVVEIEKLDSNEPVLKNALTSPDNPFFSPLFGYSVAWITPRTREGSWSLLVGGIVSPSKFRGSADSVGAVWLITLSADGDGVSASKKVSKGVGGFGGVLSDNDAFGYDVAVHDVCPDGECGRSRAIVSVAYIDQLNGGIGGRWFLTLDLDSK